MSLDRPAVRYIRIEMTEQMARVYDAELDGGADVIFQVEEKVARTLGLNGANSTILRCDPYEV